MPPAGSDRRAAAPAVAVALALASCGGGGGDDGTAAGTTGTTAAPATATTATTAPTPEGGALAEAVRPLPPAPAVPVERPAGPAPTALAVPALGVDGAPVVPVGVERGGAMEVPGVAEVGWYHHGPRPGEAQGSAVLAAHVAYDGADGVFRRLGDLAAGDGVEVRFADGSTRRFVVEDMSRHPKSELPADVFARDGAPRLVLVTCGGEFDVEARSYEDNVVVRARPA